MEGKKVSLGPADSSRIINLIRIIFGVICILVAAFWVIYSLKASLNERSVWITVAFLSGFGSYQVWAGAGKASRYIIIGRQGILLRKNSLLPEKKISAADLKKIVIHPMNVVFDFRNGKNSILRFGTDHSDSIEPVIRGIEDFAMRNDIPLDIMDDAL